MAERQTGSPLDIHPKSAVRIASATAKRKRGRPMLKPMAALPPCPKMPRRFHIKFLLLTRRSLEDQATRSRRR
jgi:hypothetical protein